LLPGQYANMLGPTKFAELYQGRILDSIYDLDYTHNAVKRFAKGKLFLIVDWMENNEM
jgi:hypothetical protein